MAKLALQANLGYNQNNRNIVRWHSAANTIPALTHLYRRCVMDTIQPHDLFQQALPFEAEKRCSRCHQIKPLSDFAKRSNRAIGVVSRCKQCLRETHPYRPYVPGKYPITSEVARSKNLKKNYGITVEEYDAMLASQGEVCKVCKGPPLGKGRYHVDHDHVTGKIRGLLCHKCNVALGMVRDNVEHLKALIAYLEEELT